MNLPEQARESCKVYLLRHGDSRTDTVRRLIGRSDTALNETGRAQAQDWHQEFSPVLLSGIYCSARVRSIETARIICSDKRQSAIIVPELNEINLGSWDGEPVCEIRRRFPLEYVQRGADLEGFRPPGGECFADLSARVLPAFEKIVHQARGNLLIVGHAGVNRVILCHLLGMPLANVFRLAQGYGCLNILEYAHGTWSVQQINIRPGISQPFSACQEY